MSSQTLPFYFQGLQELLLHMSPPLVGVVLPIGTLALVGSVVYVRRQLPGAGGGRQQERAPLIVTISALYTLAVEAGLILLDEFLHVAGMPEGSHGIGPFATWLLTGKLLHVPQQQVLWVGEAWIPLVLMIAVPWALVATLRRRLQLDARGVVLALGSFYVTSVLVLTIVGALFRGPMFHLIWPWQ